MQQTSSNDRAFVDIIELEVATHEASEREELERCESGLGECSRNGCWRRSQVGESVHSMGAL